MPSNGKEAMSMKLKVIGIIVGFIGSVILAIADLLDLKKDNGKD